MYLGTDNTKMAPKEEDLRKLILDWIEVYRYLSARWKIKSKEYIDWNKNNTADDTFLLNIRKNYLEM